MPAIASAASAVGLMPAPPAIVEAASGPCAGGPRIAAVTHAAPLAGLTAA